MNIILDTNFLMLLGNKIDIFSEIDRAIDIKYNLKTFQCVIDELKKLSKGKGKNARSAKLALKIIEKKRIPILKIKGNADEEIVKYASKYPCIIATEDRPLRQKLLNRHTPVIYLRGKTLNLLGYLP